MGLGNHLRRACEAGASRDALVAGDRRWTYGELGEVVWAYVALTSGSALSAEDLREFARSRIAAYKVPERITFLPELPKGSTGKVHRRTLRDQAIREHAS